jgi:hypothetical protein
MDEAAPAEAKPNEYSLSEFLENSPPDTQSHVTDATQMNDHGHLVLSRADVQLICDSQECDGKGKLRFEYVNDNQFLTRDQARYLFAKYVCRNCRQTVKTYAIALVADARGYGGIAWKLGELPVFGPRVPARVITLIGADRELFLSGRRAENRGLGVGAFAYYRRVVESQKGRIIQQMSKVAKKLGAAESDLKLFTLAAGETQFEKAIDIVRSAIPSALLISGRNPLTLLHKALSDGLHERTDEECLECAREIRLVLTELAERMAQVLKEESELVDAVNKLLEREAKKKLASLPKTDPEIQAGALLYDPRVKPE